MSGSPSESPDTHNHQYQDDEQAHHEEEQPIENGHGHQEVVEDEGLAAPPPILSRSSSGAAPITRTVAIIKTHALNQRFEIERRIQEASFEIVKERQMEFDTDTDPETLYELFGEDAESLAEGPVWVYVLERRRAVEVWNTLMGDPDIRVARDESPNSLRALYGISRRQNGLMGAPDVHTAEIQIASLFASSPPFPTSELPPEDGAGKFGSVRSIASSVLEQMRKVAAGGGEDEGYAPSSVTNPSTVGGGSHGRLNGNGQPGFKARGIPATNDKPDIVPRTTKAAALRAGIQLERTGSSGPRAPVSKERLAQTFANVPGHKRTSTIAVASTAAPTIAPRMTKAASLRQGKPAEAPAIRQRSLTDDSQKATFEGVPGHKRRETISVLSVKAPTVAPRLNKSAALRAQKEQAPPTSFMFKTPSLSRTSSTGSLGGSARQPQSAPRPSSQASGSISATPSRPGLHSRSSSVIGTRTPSKPSSDSKTNGSAAANGTAKSTPAPARPSSVASKPKPRPSSIGAPTIAPRLNKSAALRAAKQEAEQAAAAKAAAKKAGRGPPSSYKTLAV